MIHEKTIQEDRQSGSKVGWDASNSGEGTWIDLAYPSDQTGK